ncbi:hypothetical protein HCN44_007849 [Aphidius gifuensis]|uniref:MICAL-like protein n=1 Tax=Aphidius gifuensis TaxID=684658 RepID=A0A835CMF5_APHGI|nr:hypothetical protein HCN44_007849 [Aphidius gifuensis]
MSERRGPKALELWCRRITNSYPGVNVQNMTTSWRDGLAFCAMIHHFRPDLIDFDSLNKDDVYGNNELAFTTAEQHLGIPALLDAEDMVSCTVPDRLSILTYLSQFYQHFGATSPSRLAVNRSPENKDEEMSSVPESSKPIVAVRLGMRKETCSVCSLPVFLAEKLVISRKTYHRTCFLCARCMNQLTPGNYYETEDGQYCCETCPDEDNVPNSPTIDKIDFQCSTSDNPELSQINVIKQNLRSISDEEKTSISTNDLINKSSSSKITINLAKTSRMRLNFMENNLLDNNFESSPDEKQETQINNDKSLNKYVYKLDNNVIDNINNNNNNNNNEETITAIKLSVDNKDNVEVCQDTKEKLGVYNNVSINTNNTDEYTNDNNISQFNSIVDRELDLKMYNSGDNIDTSDFQNTIESSETILTPSEIQSTSEFFGIIELSEKSQTSIVNEEPSLIINKNINSNSVINNDENNDLKDSQLSILSAPVIDLSTEESDEYPIDMNPFENDDNESSQEIFDDKNIEKLKSMNPFDSDDGNDIEAQSSLTTPKPAIRSTTPAKNEKSNEPVKRKLKAPHINLNPFLSDDENELVSEDEIQNQSHSIATPVPKPRTLNEFHLKSSVDRPDFYASNTSLASSTTTPGKTSRKKKPAPPPPIITNEMSSPNSLNRTPRPRKSKLAPPPPMLSSPSSHTSSLDNLSLNNSTNDSMSYNSWEDEKIGKNEANKTVRNLASPSSDDYHEYLFIDKSLQGKWKRKKGPAPARPTPQRRKIKVMSLKDVKLELDEIELQQQGLEKQGVRLEKLIRDRCETGTHDDTNLTMNVEELVLELFSLVNEKNELFRRQAELMLLKRQQRLEEEHADIEYQIRCLMCQSEATKTDFDKEREEKLIQALVKIVERRSEIVECLEMDRRREVEEDKSINMHMGIYAAKSKGDITEDIEESDYPQKTKKKNKFKEFVKDKHLKKSHKKDADKDVDESEVKLERQNKKKWF